MAADALLTDLFKQLVSISVRLAKQEIKLLVGVDEEVQKLQDKLEDIKTMLDDADKRHAVKLDNEKRWLKKLQDIYYEMDDVLDTWSTARIKAEIEKEEGKPADIAVPAVVKKKVCSFFPSPSCCFNLPLRHDLGHKIKKLNEKLDEIFNDREKYGIDFKRQPEVVERPGTTSFVDESDIIGRDRNRDELLSILLGKCSPKERKPHVISLVGMGGLGKTTLAQIAYNHGEVQAHFDKKMWVCVSDPFDQCKVAKAIIESLEDQSPNATELQSLLGKLCSLIGGKRFFLVLDDVWTEDFTKWEPFRNALKCGAEGSRILVTTRKTRVANMMESSSIIDLGVLSPNDCWLIIKKIAFSDDYGEQYRDLEESGKKLANKCKGLPLAAKILGSYLRGKMSKKEWEKVLHNDLWKLEDVENGLLGPFFLSYYELSSSEKQCFLFCAVFPKDYEFNKFELIINWMAQGYINSNENMEMEVKAEHYFENLAMRSFFQDFEKDDNDGKIVSCKMHDIVHDFAESMAKDVCFKINYSGDKVEKDFKRARQLSLIVEETFSESVYKAKNLRFLNLDSRSSQIVQPKLFDYLTCLRTLHLKDRSILELPNEVEKLIHLRLLKLSCRKIKELPESICNLCNLQSLDVSECWYLKKLPQRIDKLINLRHLLFDKDIEDIKIKLFPKGIGRLTCLKTLGYFPVGKGEEICKLGELEHLNHIQGTLLICGLKNVVDFGAIKNTLKKKNDLRNLGLFFNTVEEMNSESEEEEETKEEEEEEERRRKMEKDVAILNALEPPPRLELLVIGLDYKGTTMYPNWMMSKLTYLKTLALGYCPNLEQLPPLGKLPLLEELEIWKARMIRKVGDEFLGIDIEEEELSESSNNKDIIIFPNLKSLTFEKLEEWEEWSGMGGTIEEEEEEKDNSANAFVTNNTPKIKIMPLLHSLEIGGCGNLKSLPDYLRNTPLLQELEIYGCPILERRCERGKGDYWPNISHIPNIQIDGKYVRRDGQLPDSIDSEMHDDVVEDSNHEEDDGAGIEADEQVVEVNIDEGDL
nr:putative disease resistance protein RGA3 [Quercus suber]XP_023873952.1 putative disease resistance protein RGA3 [Quercus suber]XP_023873953.1 putative disease resistance protein RGA3 [Quercus suber]XP_023873954.1 putative disease resistance protein RGA3 [Quercus suber]XP_023873955.1 putative disease resistance protein RGA3 [Quercus suber]XP_023873956.1 putative disease resistance protein RGA3 [Quercus suber]XP_023873957.1 putative disease resistance protein RGA3 [Quercus suber]XP_02387395